MRVSQLSSAISNPPVPCPGHTPTVTERALLSTYPTTHFVVPLTRSLSLSLSVAFSFSLSSSLSVLCIYAIHFTFLSQLAIVAHSLFNMRLRKNSKPRYSIRSAKCVLQWEVSNGHWPPPHSRWRIYDRVATRRYNWKLISLNGSPISSVTVNLMTITAAVLRGGRYLRILHKPQMIRIR